MSKPLKAFTVLILALSIVLTSTPQLCAAKPSQNTIFSDDFDNYPIGSFPSQWKLVFNGMGDEYQQVISDPLNASNRCLQLQGEQNWAADAVRYFQSSSDRIGFEVSVLVTACAGTTGDNVKVGLWKQVNWGQAKWTDGVAFTDNGTIVARDFVEAEGTGTVLQSYVPGQWYNIRFVLDRPNQLISVYVDGVLKGELIKGSNLPYVFDGLAISGRYTENPIDYDNIRVIEFSATKNSQEPKLTVSCISQTASSDIKVQIKGGLEYNETGIAEAPILLSYSVTGGKSWVDLTLVQTGKDGGYYAEWMPSVTGYYSLKAVYEGNENYTAAEEVINFAVEPFQEQNAFSVNSNSTLTAFSFDSDSRELSFNVSGESGTTGYVNVYVPKSRVSDVSQLAVYLDNNQVVYSSLSQGDSWVLYFTYNHSTHFVDVRLDSSSGQVALGVVEMAVLVFIGVVSAVLILGLLLVFRRKNSLKKDS